MICVKIVKLGQEIREFCFEGSVTVGHLFDAADEDFVQGNVTVNNGVVNESTVLYNNCQVFIGNKVKGNLPFEVSIVRLGAGENIALPAEDGYTINQVMQQLPDDKKAQFFGSDGKALYEYRVGGSGQPVDGSHVLSRPMSGTIRLILSTRTKGN